jgi:beta-lactamase class A
LACLAVAAVIGFGGCGFGAPKSTAPSHTVPASATAAVSPLPPTASPTTTPAPTDPPLQQAWTNQAVALMAEAQQGGSAQVHLGAGFPLTLTLRTAQVDGDDWAEATWQTPGRKGTGWLPSTAVTTTKPSGGASASFDALDSGLSDYLNDLWTKVGVQVLDVTRGTTYSFNADKQFLVASSIKVPIMLTRLSQLEASKKKPTATQISLMTSMIEHSNNDSATALYKEIGWQRGIRNFMKSIGIAGLNPAPPTTGWGYSTTTPAAMVQLLARLNAGTILNKADRDFALNLMHHVEADQQVGVGDSSPAGAIVQMKDGWIDIDDTASGPYVVNSSGIVSKAGETYVVSIYTIRDRNYPVGFAIVRHVALVVGQKLMGAS